MLWGRFFQRVGTIFLDKTRAVIGRLKQRPIFYPFVFSGVYALYDFSSWYASLWWQRKKVVYAIRRGTTVKTPQPIHVCERDDVVNNLYKALHPSSEQEAPSLFKVVVGPLGCGKTWCVTTAINKKTEVSVLCA